MPLSRHLLKFNVLILRANQDCVEEAFLPTLETLFNAPTTSPLAQVNENNVAELLVNLTDQRNLRQETALQVCSLTFTLTDLG